MAPLPIVRRPDRQSPRTIEDNSMKRTSIALAIAGLLLAGAACASSHREAPLISQTPKVDGTDFYMFRSYETGRSGYVTFIANYSPLQDAYGGPNFFSLDPNALYEIKIDNNGDAQPDLTFQFRFTNNYQNRAMNINGVSVPVPLINIGPFGTTPTANDANKNLIETYTVNVLRSSANQSLASNLGAGGTTFRKPFDNIGTKSFPDYATYADSHIARIGIPGCGEGRVFVGQRMEGFQVALGRVFDLLHLNPLGPTDGNASNTDDKNITSIALEVPIACLTTGGSPIIGAWTTASLPKSAGIPQLGYTQVSRLSAPLVNEVVIGLPDKDKFNASNPADDAQFATYVTNPTMPALINALFPQVAAPTQFPRNDLVAAFLTGVPGLNQPANVKPAEMMRLNTSIAAKPATAQNNLAVLAGDTAGFPNGRRPGDDVVDIELRALMGVLLPSNVATAGQLPYTDGVTISASQFRSTFPYLQTPLPGASDSANAAVRTTARTTSRVRH
jgi:hypothetical protein